MEKIKPKNLLKRWQYQLSHLQEQRTYIMPTKLGIYFCVLCFLLLGVAFIYNNNVAYFSCFALVSLGITSLFQTNYNMDRIKITSLLFTENHAEHPTSMKFLITNKTNQSSYHLEFHIDSKNIKKKMNSNTADVVSKKVEIPFLGPKETIEIEFMITFNERGYQKPPPIIALTFFPFGLFRSWKVKRHTEEVLVYPAKKGTLTLPGAGALGSGEQMEKFMQIQYGQDFYGHRSYQSNDSYRHIDWKAYARAKKLNIKLFDSEAQAVQLISWRQTHTLKDTESRVSQLTQWVSLCHKQRIDFILDMPEWQSPVGHTSTHLTECYYHLALFQKNGKKGFSPLPQNFDDKTSPRVNP